jgi:pimeloyl-ACP methyl ester carboxylesterase
VNRAILAGLLAVVVVVPLAACVPQAPAQSTPTDESVSAEFAPYYKQVLEWSSCENGLQCTTAIAPLDWADASGERIELALVRQPATSGNRVGSLLVNPGGPGASGFDFVANSIEFATSDRLRSSFDVVGFDPRGVGRSSAVRCYEDASEFDAVLYDIIPGTPGSDEWLESARVAKSAFADRCLELTGPLLGTVDTISAARDLDMLRAALGDQTLNYLGYSYGTLLGAVYADLFPAKTGRLVLDGALDPTASYADITLAQTVGFESAFTAYLEDCLNLAECPFRGSVTQSEDTVRALFETLAASPLGAQDGRQLGRATMMTAIILPLYSQSTWPSLSQLFTTVFAGDPTYAFELADSYYGRDAEGNFADNQFEAFIAINCLNEGSDTSVDVLRAEAEELARLAPVFGPQWAWDQGCVGWPVPAQRQLSPIVAPGSADILVIGTTNDPATPYSWAVTLAGTLEHGHLVTFEGEGHTAYNKSNSCINDVVDNFLVNGTVPPADPRC